LCSSTEDLTHFRVDHEVKIPLPIAGFLFKRYGCHFKL
jgi:hypothetical protein